MKKFYIITMMFVGLALSSFAQTGNVGIGTSSPDNSSMLDITSSDKGLLIPRVSLTNVATFQLTGASNTAGMLVYNTNASTTGGSGVGFYYWTGSVWTKVVAGTLATLNNGQIWIGNASNQPVANTMSGDVTISNTGVAAIQDNSVDGTDIQLGTETNGSLMYYDGTNWVNLAPGTSGQILKTNGAAAPTWSDPNDLFIFRNGLTETTPNIVELGGALTKATTISGLTATNKMSFTGTGVDAFNVDGTTFSVDATNDRVGIGTSAPTNTFNINNNSTVAANTFTYPLGIMRNGSTELTLGTDGSYALIQSWNSKPLLINSQGNNVGIGYTSTPSEKLSINGTASITSSNTLEFGKSVSGKQTDAGKIGYQAWTTGALDIVGAGTSGNNRVVKLWDSVRVSSLVGSGSRPVFANSSGTLIIGNGKIRETTVHDFYLPDYKSCSGCDKFMWFPRPGGSSGDDEDDNPLYERNMWIAPYNGRIVSITLAVDPTSSNSGVEISNGRFVFEHADVLPENTVSYYTNMSNGSYTDPANWNGGEYTTVYGSPTYTISSPNRGRFSVNQTEKIRWDSKGSTIFSFTKGQTLALGLSANYIEDNSYHITVVWEYDVDDY